MIERLNYHDKKIPKDPKAPVTPKEEFAHGYSQAVGRGAPLNLETKSKAYQSGVKAGLIAKEKSMNVKF